MNNKLNQSNDGIYRITLFLHGYIRELISDTIDPAIIGHICYQYLNDMDTTLLLHGYKLKNFIPDTINGKLFTAESLSTNFNHDLLIKTSGKHYKENIVKEAAKMKKFMNNNPPSSFIGFFDFFEDEKYYYLVQKGSGKSFFDFVVECHNKINNGSLSKKEWRKQCKFIFAQIIQFIQWLHDKMNYCHLDISLENLLIKNCANFDETTGKLEKCYIMFSDFDYAEEFDLNKNPLFLSNKFVGKTHYMAPKVYENQQFMANKADVWSLGVCLFMMMIGCPPYNKPTDNDISFQYIKRKQIAQLLQQWGRINYVTPNSYDLLTRMLCFDEDARITLDEIASHPWIKHYFPNNNKPIT